MDLLVAPVELAIVQYFPLSVPFLRYTPKHLSAACRE